MGDTSAVSPIGRRGISESGPVNALFVNKIDHAGGVINRAL